MLVERTEGAALDPTAVPGRELICAPGDPTCNSKLTPETPARKHPLGFFDFDTSHDRADARYGFLASGSTIVICVRKSHCGAPSGRTTL